MKKKILMIMILILIVISGLLLVKHEEDLKKTDAYKFNSEYHLSINNNVKYVNTTKALEVLKLDEAVLFICSSNNEICQKTVPILVNVINKYHLNHFYYLDISNDEPTFQIDSDNKVVKTKDGSEDYYKFLANLDPVLDENILKKDGKEYHTNEKKIGLPFVITIKNGAIYDYHEDTVTLNKEQLVFDDHNNEQRLKLIDIYSDMITRLQNA